MTEPQLRPFGAVYSYNSTNSSDNLFLIGAKGHFSAGTDASIGVGGILKTQEKPLLELKLTQNLGTFQNMNFKAQARGRFKTDGYSQFRGSVEVNHELKNGITPYAAGQVTSVNGDINTGGWAGVRYKNVAAEVEYKNYPKQNDSKWFVNFMLNI